MERARRIRRIITAFIIGLAYALPLPAMAAESILPDTGGQGTRLLTIAGIILVGIAIILIITLGKKKPK